MAHTLIRIINAIVGPTKMHFGERCPTHQLTISTKISNFWQIEYRSPLMTGSSRPRGNPAHTIIANIAKLLSRGLRPIFGGGVRHNCNTICTSNGLWMIPMVTIVLARVGASYLDMDASLCAWTNGDTFTLHSHTWRHGYNECCYKEEFHTCVRTRCNIARHTDTSGYVRCICSVKSILKTNFKLWKPKIWHEWRQMRMSS